MPRKDNAKLQSYPVQWNLVNLFIKLFSTTVDIVIMWGHNMTWRPIYSPQWYVILPLLQGIRGWTGGHWVYLYRGQWAPCGWLRQMRLHWKEAEGLRGQAPEAQMTASSSPSSGLGLEGTAASSMASLDEDRSSQILPFSRFVIFCCGKGFSYILQRKRK